MKYEGTTLEDLEMKTGTELVEIYNDVAPHIDRKEVKKFATHEKAVKRTWDALTEYRQAQAESGEEAAEPGADVVEENGVAGTFNYCPHCSVHLEEGNFLKHGDDINGEIINLGHEFECMNCGGEFGEEVESEDDSRERRQGDRRQDERPEDDPIEKTAVVKKEREPRPALRKDDRIIVAGDSPSGRMIVMGAIWEIAGESPEGLTQGDLIEQVLTDFKPPRSKRFGRDYILGYISFGLQKGYLKEKKEAAKKAA